ncbi:MAG: hypothetical protein K2V38_13945 [Gemmataceae bacterium]|nr:hypothetical protein [Gemmataceae bacterium]
MRTFLSLAVVLALGPVVSAAETAPTPKEKAAPSIDGKYNLVSMSTPADRAAAGPGAGPGGIVIGGPGGGFGRLSMGSAFMAGPAVITKNEITLEGAAKALPPQTAALYGISPGGTTMSYALDAAKMTIDVEVADKRGKKSKQLGLVEIVDDRLVIALAKEGDDRPKTTEEAGDVTVYYFQKVPQTKTEFRLVTMAAGKEAEAEKELNRLSQEGFELVSTTAVATDAKSSPTGVTFVLKRTFTTK